MQDLREIFIKHLTEDVDPKEATAIFNKNDGENQWAAVRLDMIMSRFDVALREYNKIVK